MATLTEKTEILEVTEAHHSRGVTFSAATFKASTVTVDFTRWIDMGKPARIVVTITPAR